MTETRTQLVSGIIIQNNKVLLGLRKNTEYFAGFWSLPVGHIEKNELAQDALKRELMEELGIKLVRSTSFCIKTDEALSISNQVYRIESWSGKISNKEPELCSELAWFSLDELPDNLTSVSRDILKPLIHPKI